MLIWFMNKIYLFFILVCCVQSYLLPFSCRLRLRFSLPLIKITARIDRPQTQRNYGRFPFSQNFRNFRFGGKWNTFGRFVPLENSQKKWKSKKVVPFSRLEFPNGMSCSIDVLYRFQVYGRAPGHVPGFTTKWTNFLPIGNSTFATTEISGFFS